MESSREATRANLVRAGHAARTKLVVRYAPERRLSLLHIACIASDGRVLRKAKEEECLHIQSARSSTMEGPKAQQAFFPECFRGGQIQRDPDGALRSINARSSVLPVRTGLRNAAWSREQSKRCAYTA